MYYFVYFHYTSPRWLSHVTAASVTARMSSSHTDGHAGHSSRWSAVGGGGVTADTHGVISVSKFVHFSVESASTRWNSVWLTPEGTLQLLLRRLNRWPVDEAFQSGIFLTNS